MITKVGTPVKEKKVSSIKKAEQAVERKIRKEIANNGEEPLIGRMCYGFCEGCQDSSVQKIYTNYTKCWTCGNLYHFTLRGEVKPAAQTYEPILFMI